MREVDRIRRGASRHPFTVVRHEAVRPVGGRRRGGRRSSPSRTARLRPEPNYRDRGAHSPARRPSNSEACRSCTRLRHWGSTRRRFRVTPRARVRQRGGPAGRVRRSLGHGRHQVAQISPLLTAPAFDTKQRRKGPKATSLIWTPLGSRNQVSGKCTLRTMTGAAPQRRANRDWTRIVAERIGYSIKKHLGLAHPSLAAAPARSRWTASTPLFCGSTTRRC